jgi:hypothetical protein
MSNKKSAKNVMPDPELARWCQALTIAQTEDEVPPGWFTTRALAAKLAKPRASLQRTLYAAVEAGRCEVRSFRVNVGRFSRSTPHYRLK